MGRTRKKAIEESKEESDSQDSQSEVAIAENANGNCKQATVSKKHKLPVLKGSEKNIHKTVKQGKKDAKVNEMIEESEDSVNSTEKVQFDEDQDQIEFEVEQNSEFLSDGKVDSEVEDESNGDQDNSLDRSVISEQNTQLNEQSEDLQTTDSEQVRPQRSRPRSVVKRRSVEEKLDDLTSTLMTMKDLMEKKGFFDEDSEDKPRKKKAKTGSVLESDTTIYRNTVEHQPMQEPADEENEITFNLKR